MLIQNFFNIPIEEVVNYEIKVESKRVLFWFDYQILHLTPVTKKGAKNDKKEEISENNSNSRQDRKVSSNSEKPKKLFT